MNTTDFIPPASCLVPPASRAAAPALGLAQSQISAAFDIARLFGPEEGVRVLHQLRARQVARDITAESFGVEVRVVSGAAGRR